MSASFPVTTAVVGVGLRQYKRGAAPLPEQGVLIHAIVDACEDAGIDPATVDGFVSYADDKNEPTRLMNELGTRDLCWSTQVWGGGGGGIAATLGLAAAAIMTGQAQTVAHLQGAGPGEQREAVGRRHGAPPERSPDRRRGGGARPGVRHARPADDGA